MSDMILFEWKSLRQGSFDLPVMKFCGGLSKDSNEYSALYWLPSVQCVLDMLKSLGFAHSFVVDDSAWRRTVIISSRIENAIFEKKNKFDVGKFTLIKRMTRGYIGSILRLLRNRDVRWW